MAESACGAFSERAQGGVGSRAKGATLAREQQAGWQ
jgi:hypothetical protein